MQLIQDFEDVGAVNKQLEGMLGNEAMGASIGLFADGGWLSQ